MVASLRVLSLAGRRISGRIRTEIRDDQFVPIATPFGTPVSHVSDQGLKGYPSTPYGCPMLRANPGRNVTPHYRPSYRDCARSHGIRRLAPHLSRPTRRPESLDN